MIAKYASKPCLDCYLAQRTLNFAFKIGLVANKTTPRRQPNVAVH